MNVLDLASKIMTVLHCGIEDLLEVVSELQINAGQVCVTPMQQSQSVQQPIDLQAPSAWIG